jgi:hypothetical protein
MLNLEVGNSYQSRYVLKCPSLVDYGRYLTKYQISNFKQYNPCSNMLESRYPTNLNSPNWYYLDMIVIDEKFVVIKEINGYLVDMILINSFRSGYDGKVMVLSRHLMLLSTKMLHKTSLLNTPTTWWQTDAILAPLMSHLCTKIYNGVTSRKLTKKRVILYDDFDDSRKCLTVTSRKTGPECQQ